MNDTELKSLIKSRMRQDKGNPFFVRKVMNRLPHKPQPTADKWALRGACLASVLILGYLWTDFMTSVSSVGVYFFLLWAATLFVTYIFLRDIIAR